MTLDEEGRNNFLNHAMSIWINPEIEKRKKDGKLSENFSIHKAQVLLPPDEKAIIKLNEEVEAVTSYKLKKLDIKKAEAIYPGDIDEKAEIKLGRLNPNYGHVTMILSGDKWIILIDFRTNKALNLESQNKGEQNLTSASESLSNPENFITNIKSAAKIFVTNILRTLYGEKWLQEKTFEEIKGKYVEFIDLGNQKPEFKYLINTLFDSDSENKTILTKEEMDNMILITTELSKYSRHMSC